MLSIIFTENSSTSNAWAKIITALTGNGAAEVFSLSPSGRTVLAQATTIPATDSSTGKRLSMAMSRATGDTLLFIDSRIELSEQEAAAIGSALQSNSQATISYAPIRIGEETIELPEMDADNLVAAISDSQSWPTGLVAVRRSFMNKIDIAAATSLSEALMLAIITAGAEGEMISRMDQELGMTISPESYSICQLTKSESSRLLQCAVNNARIEDLFPNHPWSTHGEESAAASYHELAARFMKMNDLQSAEECLAHGDKFEDSPRALALKGIISILRGETLGAVANMVSSLQQYELRKKENSSVHYVTFSPNNLESINSNLNQGLEALNRRDNDSAVEFFKEAVFQFDPFFKATGIDALAN